MRYLFLCLCILGFSSHSTDYDWRGIGSTCGDTLQSCINNVAEGDSIYIKTNIVIDESIVTSNSVSLIAGDGYTPTFAEGHSIEITHDAATNLVIKGLTLLDGKIDVDYDPSGNLVSGISIESNIINFTTFPGERNCLLVEYQGGSNSILNINIDYNIISNLNTDDNYAKGLSVLMGGSVSDIQNVNARIYGNEINLQSSTALNTGMEFRIGTGDDLVFNVIGNEVYGDFSKGLVIDDSLFEKNLEFNIVSNSIIGAQSGGTGIYLDDDFSSRVNDQLRIVNNTILNTAVGLDFHLPDTMSDFQISLNNNLIAYNGTGLLSDVILFETQLTSDENNLFFNNSSFVNYDPTFSTSNIIPEEPIPQIIQSRTNGRLVQDSIAIDQANASFLTIENIPYIDADGLYREKDGNGNGTVALDIGAYEYGGNLFVHQHSGDFLTSTDMDHESTNGNPNLGGLIHVTSLFNTDGSTFGNLNRDNETLFYNAGTGKWALYNQGDEYLRDGATFNVLNLSKSYTTFEHKVDTALNFSIINKPGLNAHADKVLQVTPYWDGSTSSYNPHPIGVSYSSFQEKWRIFSLDAGDMPINTNFNINYQDESKSAFKYTASLKSRIPGYNFTTILDHPALNGKLCAQIQVTQSLQNSIYNNTPVALWYDNRIQKWSIFNQDYSPMPVGTTFHVLINPAQIDACSDVIFANSFD